ncbi:unnamed protein product [Caenorhabditis angaria]|uniref:Peptidase M1 leukotriene A4 hydrolase/aminopeptidase C-terminal domain-containing protein n=1 Tax=Caenorhabditis angaria TaxID=860376 RepID=A0A9P1IK07_9PELO|nr:unnamed protein product [Caenorhabditis angaria]
MVHPLDPSTGSNYTEIHVESYDLTWKIDFEREKIEGSVDVELKAVKSTNQVLLDTRALEIREVSSNPAENLKFEVLENPGLGQILKIDTGKQLAEGEKIKLRIAYSTGKNATALQFLTADQTTDGKAPYLFSQCQAINARSIVPCMDTPSVKSTYRSTVHVPLGLTCLMSAIGKSHEKSACGKFEVFKFEQPVQIPAYLLAIVVGRLESRKISERCAVWAEPSQASAAEYEFAETESILKVAENVAGPYVWGRYDLVVLPASFPFGGMENPCLTFITPTLLAGDRSLVNVIAHEIAHSWTGNLVTNFSWEHFWLNEGFTVFLERKIHGRMHGEKERQFECQQGFENTLIPTVKTWGPDHEFTKLIQKLGNIDPDEAFSSIPYEKGSALLLTIEQAIGDNSRFEEFLRSYIQKFAYKTVSTDEFQEYLYSSFSDKRIILDNIDWNLWLNSPGLPPKPKFDTTLTDECKKLAGNWTRSTEIPAGTETIYEKMSSAQKLAVIDEIRANRGVFGVEKMPALTEAYKLDKVKHSEIKFSWLLLGLDTKFEPIIEPSLAFAAAVGRMKYCKPIYRALFNWQATRSRAIAQFQQNIPKMNPITVKAIQGLLKA